MNEKLEFLCVEPDFTLRGKIISKIERKAKNKAIIGLVYSGLTSVTSVLVAIYSLLIIVKDFYSSGLSEFLSLMSSDYSVIFSLWKEYLMSVVESLPVISIMAVVFSVWIFILSVKYVLNNLKAFSLIKFNFNK